MKGDRKLAGNEEIRDLRLKSIVKVRNYVYADVIYRWIYAQSQ